MRDPTFLVIGAQKGGTTWLHRVLRQHPDLVTPAEKEIDFFHRREVYRAGIGWYRGHFAGPETGAGEVAPNYLWTEVDQAEVPEVAVLPNPAALVREHCPDVKLIVSLRNPVDRAISAYYHHLRVGRLSPRRGIGECFERYGIVTMGEYDRHLANWLEHFPADRFLMLVYEEDIVGEAKSATVERVFAHIGVDPSFRPERLHETVNTRVSHFDMRVGRVPAQPRAVLSRLTPDRVKRSGIWDIEVSAAERGLLGRHFEPHNRALAELLGRSLPW